jgi:hypothetical protein
MTDYADIYFIDGRNATVTGGHAPPGRVVVGSQGGQLNVRAPQPMSPYGQAPMYGPQGYYAPPGAGYFGPSILGRISAGQLIDMVAQIFVALMPLPAAPAVTSDAATDTGNAILYQSALASHAKRDEQVRTLGSLVSKLVG